MYGNWASDALYVDASVQRGQFRNRVQGEGLAEKRYDSDIWQSSLEAGYRFGIGQIGNTSLSLQPELQLIYTDTHSDVHTEANGTVVRAQGGSGLSARAGRRRASTAGGAWGPCARRLCRRYPVLEPRTVCRPHCHAGRPLRYMRSTGQGMALARINFAERELGPALALGQRAQQAKPEPHSIAP